jgi:hypothetical protein
LSNNNPNPTPLTPAEIEVRVWAFVVGIVTVILAGIVFFMLYSVTFVTQPIKSMAPIDQGYLKMLNDIVLLIVGGIGGVMTKRAVGAVGNLGTPASPPPAPPAPAPQGGPQPPLQQAVTGGLFGNAMGAMPVFINPELDESWTPPPPPSTPPEHMESDQYRERIAAARLEAGT